MELPWHIRAIAYMLSRVKTPVIFVDVGKFCEVDLNECESEPCANGGTCIDRPGHFVCVCVEGFGGETCQRAGTVLHQLNSLYIVSLYRTTNSVENLKF